MVYIDAIKGSCFALVIFIVVSVFVQPQAQVKGIENIITVSTFLFAILAGFFMSRMNSRYDSIREFVAKEDAMWLALYEDSKMFGKKFTKRVGELIDKYYIVAYDYIEFNDYYKHNAKYFLAIYDELNKISRRRRDGSFQSMLDTLGSIEENRNQSSVMLLERVTMGQWAILVLLSATVIFSMYFTKTIDIFSHVTTVLLSTVLVLVVLVLRDLQNQRLGGTWMLVESGEELFEFLGKLRYYPKNSLKDGSVKIPDYVKKYRLGLHEPGAEKLEIKIVKRK